MSADLKAFLDEYEPRLRKWEQSTGDEQLRHHIRELAECCKAIRTALDATTQFDRPPLTDKKQAQADRQAERDSILARQRAEREKAFLIAEHERRLDDEAKSAAALADRRR
jgi:hypothetical protein